MFVDTPPPDALLLDARDYTQYRAGHLPGALGVSLGDFICQDRYGAHLACPPESASRILRDMGITKNQKVTIYGDIIDPAAARIAWTLSYVGCDDISILGSTPTDMTDTTLQSIPPSQFTYSIRSELRATSDDLEGVTLVDARTPMEYMAGHIPNAISMPYTMGITDDGHSMRTAIQLRSIFGRIAKPDDTIICYCAHGHRASSVWAQMIHAGYRDVRVYDGSFVQWTGMGLPVQ